MLTQYRNTHLWLLVPFGIVLIAFLPSYWLAFAEAPWRQHLHGLTATAWFILLIAQPYLVTRGHGQSVHVHCGAGGENELVDQIRGRGVQDVAGCYAIRSGAVGKQRIQSVRSAVAPMPGALPERSSYFRSTK